MSKQYPGGFVVKNPTSPTSSTASGIWTLDQAMQYNKAYTWPGVLPPVPITSTYSIPSATPIDYTVPLGTTQLTIHMWAGNGGASNPQLYRLNVANTPSLGGKGAYLNGTLAVTGGDIISVYVGGAGGDAISSAAGATAGINGGMATLSGEYGTGGGGGGWSGIKKNGVWIAIAGGGGGGGHGDGYGNRGYGPSEGGNGGTAASSGAGTAGTVPAGNRGGTTYSGGGGAGGTVGTAPTMGLPVIRSTMVYAPTNGTANGGGGGGGGANGGNGSQGADAGHPCPGGGGGGSLIPSGWGSSLLRTYPGAPVKDGAVIIIRN